MGEKSQLVEADPLRILSPSALLSGAPFPLRKRVGQTENLPRLIRFRFGTVGWS